MKKIVLIEDRADSRLLIKESLEKSGYSLKTAGDVDSGMQIIKSYNPHLVILDLMLPGKTGLVALELIRKQYDSKTMKILILTAAKLDEDQLNYFLKSGADEIMLKPLKIKEVRELVKKLLG